VAAHEDPDDIDPFGQACFRLTSAGLWPPIIGFDMDWEEFDESGEPIDETAVILHELDLSQDVQDQIHRLMDGLPYKLTRVTRRAGHGVPDGQVQIVDEAGKVRGGSFYKRGPNLGP